MTLYFCLNKLTGELKWFRYFENAYDFAVLYPDEWETSSTYFMEAGS